MFTPAERAELLEELVRRARDDQAVVGAALVGSIATGEADDHSDIDLMLQLAPGVERGAAVGRWTQVLYGEHGAVHHLDVFAQGTVYRVFLLASTLQVDVSFWDHDEFRAVGGAYEQLFGEQLPTTAPSRLDPLQAVGYGWLYALHSRSALARGKVFQAVMMLDELRDQVLALACSRHGLRPHHGRDVDKLPEGVLEALAAARAASLEPVHLKGSHTALVLLLRDEVLFLSSDNEAFARLPAALAELARPIT